MRGRLTSAIHRLFSTGGYKPEVPIYEVTGEIDWATLDVIHWSPAWLTPSERLLLYALIFSPRPARYLEIGTHSGGSALIVAAALDAIHTNGRLICVAPRPQIAPEHWELLKYRTTLLEGSSPDILPLARESAGGPFDFVFIFHDAFNPDIARAIRGFATRHRQITDCGPLTREFTTATSRQGKTTRWGGLHLMRVLHQA